MEAILAGRRGVGRAFLEQDGRPMVNLAVPVFDVTGARVLGGMVAQVNLRGIVDNTVSVARGKSGYLFVVDERGRLLGHEDFSQVLQSRDVTGSWAVRQLLAGANPADLPTPHLYRSYQRQIGQIMTDHYWAQRRAQSEARLDRAANRISGRDTRMW